MHLCDVGSLTYESESLSWFKRGLKIGHSRFGWTPFLALSLVTALAVLSSLEECGEVKSVGDNASSSDQNNIGDRSDRQSEKSRAKTDGKKSTG